MITEPLAHSMNATPLWSYVWGDTIPMVLVWLAMLNNGVCLSFDLYSIVVQGISSHLTVFLLLQCEEKQAEPQAQYLSELERYWLET